MTLNESEKQKLLTELEYFCEDLGSYRDIVLEFLALLKQDAKLGKEYKYKRELQDLSMELQRKYGSLKEAIQKYGGPAVLPLQDGKYKCEVFLEMFSYVKFSPSAFEAVMNTAITTVNMAIGKLEAEPEPMKQSQTATSSESPNVLFDNMKLHPKVIQASESLFRSQHYSQAIFEAFKTLNNFVKQKTGLSSLDGKALMAEAFKEQHPAIKLNQGVTQSDKDEQEGFKFLFMGAMAGIRNPKAHENIVQTDPYRTLEYLGFASLLIRRVEEGERIYHQQE